MGSIEPFNRLVRLAARAFYDDISMKGDNQPKTSRGDNRGMAVVVLDALTRRQWVREEDLAKALKLHSKQLRRILRFFEEEKLVTRDHRKESAKGAKIYSAAAAAAGDGPPVTKEGEEKVKMHTHSYCCLDYAQICDVVRYRIHRMKKKLKDELDSRNTIQHYICPNCKKRYSAFDALQLVSYTDEYFHCENCNGELVAESDKLASEEMGDGDDNARKRRREKLHDMQQRIDEQLKPLQAQLNRVKDLPAPEFGSLQSWERANIGAFGSADPNAADSSKNSQSQYNGTPMPYLGETKVEVALSGTGVKDGSAESGTNGNALKVLPPWMIRQGMTLTKEQRGETSNSSNLDEKSEVKDEKKQDSKEDEKSIQDEYIKAYYEAFRKKQEEEDAKRRVKQEGETLASVSHSERQVGMKSKREDDDEGVEWEEEQPTGNTAETYKLADLNVEAQESGDEEDNIVWQDG
ncbi:general transcription factor IIE subunit 1 [Oryza brachyantha]|uniref:general transcription factor IIE subunit 1 n=1 Tax=Oryza brachyantha TaxID=4533 RepID=UPI001ADD121D|nr:general transcription factor IIE subunit 1 [Oryza brachyantha]